MKKLIMTFLAVLLTAGTSFALAISGGHLEVDGRTYYDSGAQAFKLIDSDGAQDDATAFLFLEIAGYAQSNTFGLYTFDRAPDGTVSAVDSLEIFNGAAGPVTSATLKFDFSVGTVTHAGTNQSISISRNNFGFYLGSPDGTFYSHSELNADGADHFLTFDTSDNAAGSLLGSDYVLAMEDLYGLGDNSFDDMVVGVSDITATPEPGTLLLLGGGLIGLAYLRKRKKA
jgi:hypothetical protein